MKKCSSKTCRTPHYPNYRTVKVNGEHVIKYYENWYDNHFIISSKTAFSINYLSMNKAAVQRAKVSFKGAEGTYNFMHNYKEPDYCPKRNAKCSKSDESEDVNVDQVKETLPFQCEDDKSEDNTSSSTFSISHLLQNEKSRTSLNRNLLEVEHFRYSLLHFFERHGLSANDVFVSHNLDETIKMNIDACRDMFNTFSNAHKCDVPGCNTCLVMDGNQKNTRRKCAMKEVFEYHSELGEEFIMKTGCPETPLMASTYCSIHSDFTGKSSKLVSNSHIEDNTDKESPNSQSDKENSSQVEKTYLIESIINHKKLAGKDLYLIKWIGYKQTTWEHKENVPRTMIEKYNLFGQLEVETFISATTNVNGRCFVNILWKVPGQDDNSSSKTMWLPECSLKVDPQAYQLKLSKRDLSKLEYSSSEIEYTKDGKCNTRKDRVRFYSRSAGILLSAYPCQHIRMLCELFNSESITQVYAHLHDHLKENISNKTYNVEDMVIVYDDACHLKKFAIKRPNLSDTSKYMSECDIYCDRLHFSNHVDKWCHDHCNPSDCDKLKGVNTEACEQIFSWLSRYAYITRYMNRYRFFFFILDMADLHNYMIENRS